MKKNHVNLSSNDKVNLEKILSKGSLTSKKYNRSLGLLELNKGKTYQEVSELVGKNPVTISKWAKKYKESGLDFLEDKPRSGRPKELEGITQAKIIALACTDPPAGYSKWSVRLLAKKIVELNYCEEISKTTVSEILKKTT